MDVWKQKIEGGIKEVTNTQEVHYVEIKKNDEKSRRDDVDMETRLLAKIEEAKFHR